MRIAILGDFHLGYPRFEEDSFVQAERALRKANERADLLIIAGDIFDTKVPKPEVMSRAFRIFSQVDKEVIVIAGTHERRAKGYTNPVDLLCEAGFAKSCHAHPVIVENGSERIAVQGMNGVPEEYASAALRALNPQPVEGAFNIFVFHQNLKDLMPVVEHGLTFDDLPKGFDLYVDGHIHTHHFIKDPLKLIIPGSTVLTQLRKEERSKGFYLFNTESGEAEFVEIETRPFQVLSVDVNGLRPADVYERVRALPVKEGAVVRIDLEGDLQEGYLPSDIDVQRIKSMFPDSHVEVFIHSTAIPLTNAEIEGLRSDLVGAKEMALKILDEIAGGRIDARRMLETLRDRDPEDIVGDY